MTNQQPDKQTQIKALEDLIDMFGTDGWKEYTNYLTDLQTTARNDFEHINESDAFFVRKGNLQTLGWFMNFENLMRMQYEDMLLEEDSEDLDAVI